MNPDAAEPSPAERVEALSPQKRRLLEQLREQRERASAPAVGAVAAPEGVGGGPGYGRRSVGPAEGLGGSADFGPGAAASGAVPAGPVLLRTGSAAPQLVLLHPSGGALFCYVPLIRWLEPGPRIVGFPAIAGDRGIPLEQRVAGVAERVLSALLREGTLHRSVLAGWSFGGSVAYEAARQSELQGAGAPPVVLIDPPFLEDSTVPVPDPACQRRQFVFDLARLDGIPEEKLVAQLGSGRDGDASLGEGEAPDSMADLLDRCGVRSAFTPDELEDRFLTFSAAASALHRYQPPAGYPGPVSLLTAGPEPGISARWCAAVSGPFDHGVLAGDHYTVFDGGNLPIVGEAVRRALGRVA